jgi:hypothetical protein
MLLLKFQCIFVTNDGLSQAVPTMQLGPSSHLNGVSRIWIGFQIPGIGRIRGIFRISAERT